MQSTIESLAGESSPACSLCGAALAVREPDGRAPLDTLKLDATSLATLVRLGESSHVAAEHDGAGNHVRAPQLSIPFELSRERAIPNDGPRAPQQSIPFELSREAAQPLVAPRTPDLPLPLMTPYRAPPAPEKWEDAYVSRVRGRRTGRLLLLFMILVAAAVVALVSRGVLEPRRLLEWMPDAVRSVLKRL